MSIESNINSYYEELIASMSERAKDNLDDGGYGDESDCIWQAIDDSLIYYCDQGYVLAMATCRGYLNWYKDINWDEITEMLFDDVMEEIDYMKKNEQESEKEEDEQ